MFADHFGQRSQIRIDGVLSLDGSRLFSHAWQPTFERLHQPPWLRKQNRRVGGRKFVVLLGKSVQIRPVGQQMFADG